MTTALVIHGHFYQPPRENPWTDHVDREPSAAPFHDWNERIHAECYRPNGFARIFDDEARVRLVVNNYARISFNFGPTLLSWLERHQPDTYARILEADRESALSRGGHGNAIAQGYNHSILPLSNARDRRTQIRWGLSDFRRRFGRDSESLWLPETACDPATLEALIDEDLKYVILSPFQAARVRREGEEDWKAVSGGRVDTTVPYKFKHRDGSGRSIAVFFYEGRVARALAFEGLLGSSQVFMGTCAQAAHAGSQLVSVATDGESYGHHFRWGERCLAYSLEEEAERRGLRVTNYGEFLEEHEPAWEVELEEGPDGEGTAWSCAHGLGRWTRDCGCHAGAPSGWNQQWRAPLRAALDFLRDDFAQKFEWAAGELLTDPWAARDDYAGLLGGGAEAREDFLRHHSKRPLSRDESSRVLTLLEAQRAAMTMYTSCGWFFNDISGIETLQVLRYAGRVVELVRDLGLDPPLAGFLETLSEARSNVTANGNGADIFLRAVEHSRVTPARVAAHLAICDLVGRADAEAECDAAGYAHRKTDFQQRRHGRVTLQTTRLSLEESATGRLYDFALAAMHFGEIDYYCALRPFKDTAGFAASSERLWSQLRAASLPVLLRVAQEEFGPEEFGVEALLPRGQGRLSESVFGGLVARFTAEYEHLYEENRRVVERLQEIGFHLPRELRAAAELTVGRRLESELRAERAAGGDYARALEIAREAARHGYHLESASLDRAYEEALTGAALKLARRPTSEGLQPAHTLLALGRELGLETGIERAQEVVYASLRGGRPAADGLRDFALALGVSPSVYERAPADVDEAEATLT
ncbi:MAG TPA: DUF3536 domain-containing protein [Pyrinomonadaceae bacterium]|nr:DUF3536 domain-containing protein [Pyrinomonadaceae bacterium]